MPSVPHIQTNPNIKPVSSNDAEWLRVSADLAVLVRTYCARTDLVVIAAPGASATAPGCYTPAYASIELDSDRCFTGIDPASIHADNPLDLPRYAAGIGVLVHEGAHATHSIWQEDATWPALVRDAAVLLEELRIEAAQLRRRPIDRDWLRASTKAIIAPNLAIGDPKKLDAWDAANAAALLLGRVDAQVLTAPEVEVARKSLSRALTKRILERLERIWRSAIRTGDNDGTRMRRLGERWCKLLLNDKYSGTGRTPRKTKARQRAIAAALTAAGQVAANPFTPGGDGTQPPVPNLTGGAATGNGIFGRHRQLATRTATGAEHTAARRLARALQQAAATERITTTVTSRVPPGRLRMGAVIAGKAQAASGAPITAEPWCATRRKRPPAPRPKVGIALDVSVSMGAFIDAASASAWICAHAAAHAHGAAAAITFGTSAKSLVRPGPPPERIPQPRLESSTNHLDAGIDALDEALDLSHIGKDARILVLVTDGGLTGNQPRPVATRLAALAAAGCALVQIAPDSDYRHLPHTTLVRCADPATAISEITAAVTKAMAAASYTH